MNDDEKFMSRALFLASKGEGKVSPNPLVGAVIVKEGRIIGEGWHEFFGGPHAEVNAIADAESRAASAGKGESPARSSIRGATLYISLEPCSHSGGTKKTPPCVPLIIKKGIKRVVIAAEDRNPEVKGIEQLKFAGIRIKSGILKQEAEEQNEAFFKHISTEKPFVALKLAQSANGVIGCAGKNNVRVSGKEFDDYVQKLRNRYDAILVGINTVLTDNPRLTCRLKGGRNPVRIIMDSHLRTPLNAKVLSSAHKDRVIIASVGFNFKKEEALKEKGAHVLICGKTQLPSATDVSPRKLGEKEADLKALIESLPALGIYSVLIEGGAQIAESALKERLVDRLIVAVSPKKISGSGLVPSPISAALLKKLGKRQMGKDTVYSGVL